MKPENNMKRQQASIRLKKEFDLTDKKIAEIFNVTKQRINDEIKKENNYKNKEDLIYIATTEEIGYIEKMVKEEKYNYENDKFKIELLNDYNKKFAIIVENILNKENTKVIFENDILKEKEWEKVVYNIKEYRLDELKAEEKELIKNSKTVYVTNIPFFRPNDYNIFHKYKKIRNLTEDEYTKFLKVDKYIPNKYEYTDDKIKKDIEKDIKENRMKIIEGKLHIPSDSWLRNRCNRQEELTGRHLALSEFIEIYGYEQYNNKDKSLDLVDLYNLKKEIKEIEKIERLLENKNVKVDEKEAIVKTRIGQSLYRKLLLQKYNSKCCICNLSYEPLLVASHIKEWSKSNNNERCDVNNGLLLCRAHDALFDKHLISFDKKGKIIISKLLSKEDRKILNIDDNIKINLNDEMERYMEFNRKLLK